MEAEPTRVIKIFYCYARKDKALRDELEKHLGALKRSGQITTWFDREILPGKEWAQEIDTSLNTADLVLLLVSPDFIYSDYCYSKEMIRALERREAGETHVIPIILRPVDCEGTPISKLQMLPTDGKPVTKWNSRDDAFRDIAGEIRKEVAALQKSVKQWGIEGKAHFSAKRYQEALTACEHAIRLRPNEAILHANMGFILRYLKRYDEALAAAEQAISLNPNDALIHLEKGRNLKQLERYSAALVAFGDAIRLRPNEAILHRERGEVLFKLQRHKEALAAAEQAINLNPNDALAYHNKGWALRLLRRYQESQEAFDKAEELGYGRR